MDIATHDKLIRLVRDAHAYGQFYGYNIQTNMNHGASSFGVFSSFSIPTAAVTYSYILEYKIAFTHSDMLSSNFTEFSYYDTLNRGIRDLRRYHDAYDNTVIIHYQIYIGEDADSFVKKLEEEVYRRYDLEAIEAIEEILSQ